MPSKHFRLLTRVNELAARIGKKNQISLRGIDRVDYEGGAWCDDEEWEEIARDDWTTVFRSRKTGEIRAKDWRRIPDDEIPVELRPFL